MIKNKEKVKNMRVRRINIRIPKKNIHGVEHAFYNSDFFGMLVKEISRYINPANPMHLGSLLTELKYELKNSVNNEIVELIRRFNIPLFENTKCSNSSIDIMLLSYILQKKLVFLSPFKYLNLLSGDFDTTINIHTCASSNVIAFEFLPLINARIKYLESCEILSQIVMNARNHSFISGENINNRCRARFNT